MAEVDQEIVERVRRWCAAAGREAGAAEIRAALAPLSWDELLVAKALLEDPPPARPLGPRALADIARGAPPDVAAERERGGRYPRGGDLARPDRAEERAAVPTPRSRGRAARAGRAQRGGAVIVRRARDRASPAAATVPALPGLEALRAPSGRNVLERLMRTHGARRAAIARALAAGFRREDGSAPTEADLADLLQLHGLQRAFERREKDEILHALRAAGGVRATAATRLGADVPGLEAALDRLGARRDADAIREERRADLRSRATLSERVGLLLHDTERLADLDLLRELEEDLRRRLPEHVRALATTGERLVAALSRSLSIAPAEAEALAARFGLALATPSRPAHPLPPRRPERPRRPGRTRDRTGRTGGAEPRREDRGPRRPGPEGATRPPRPPRPGAPGKPRPRPRAAPRPGAGRPPRRPRGR
jgi:hypothetical protein